MIKAAVRREGLRLPLGDPERTAQKLAAVAVRSSVRDELAPLIAVLDPLNGEIAAADRRIEHLGTAHPMVKRLLYVANALTNQRVGLEETDDGLWAIYFHSILLATFDERDCIIPS